MFRVVASDYQLHLMKINLTSAAAVLILVAMTAAANAQTAPPLSLVIRDHQFVPAELSLPAGVKSEVVIRNEQAVPAEFESSSLHREKVVPPGGTASVFVGPLNAGRYEFFDDFHPATRGVIVVK
jgi:cupredoxin-like protein